MRQPSVASGLARFSALLNAPGCECVAIPGYGKKPCPPTPVRGIQPTCPGSALLPPPGLALMRLWGPGGATPVYYPSGGSNRHSSILPPSSNGVFSGLPGCLGLGEPRLRRVKCMFTCRPSSWSPLSVPSYPPRRGGGSRLTTLPPSHRPGFDMHCTQCTICVPAPAPCVTWVRAS